jgi:hypothetical protein
MLSQETLFFIRIHRPERGMAVLPEALHGNGAMCRAVANGPAECGWRDS